jgi:Flp pilus assembly protein CpaB
MTPKHAVGRGVTTRLSGGHLLMLAAGLLGAVSTFAALRAADHTTAVIVAGADLQAGDRIAADDLGVARIGGSKTMLGRFVAESERGALLGKIVVTPLERGTPILDQYVLEPAAPNKARAMSFSVGSDRAVAGAIEIGDRIDVLAVDRDGVVGYALADALVMDRDRAGDGAPIRSSGSDDITLTVAVDSMGARRLAAALADGDITVVRSTGADPIDDIAWYELDGATIGSDAGDA